QFDLASIGNNNCSTYFTSLVRYPFGTAAVTTGASPSHSVWVVGPGNTTIRMEGKDGLNVIKTIDFVFTPIGTVNFSSLSGAFALSNMQINQGNNLNYDFTIKAHYSTGTQNFQV